MRLSRSTGYTVLLGALVLALIIGVFNRAWAQDTTKDTTQAPPPAEAGAQPAVSDEPAAEPAEEVDQSDDAAEPDTEGTETETQEPNDQPTTPPTETPVQDAAQQAADTTTQAGSNQAAEPTGEQGSEPAAAEQATAPPAGNVNPDAPYEYVEFAEGEKPVVMIKTSMGDIDVELWPDVAPRHCQSFVHLVKSGYYDSLMFHRVVPGFVIQGGDPLGNGTGGPGYKLPPEFSDRPHREGTLSMARLPSDPSSAGSQFFICLGRLQSLDGDYTVFGEVIRGLDVLHTIERVPVQAERPKTPVYMVEVTMKSDGAAETPKETTKDPGQPK